MNDFSASGLYVPNYTDNLLNSIQDQNNYIGGYGAYSNAFGGKSFADQYSQMRGDLGGLSYQNAMQQPQAKSWWADIASGVNAVANIGQGVAGIMQARAIKKYNDKMAALYEKEYNSNLARQRLAQANYDKVYGGL